MADGRVNITDTPYFANNAGGADCWGAIQQAIQDVNTASHANYGRAIYFPPGTYLVTLVTSPINVNATWKATLHGSGREQTILRMYPSTDTNHIGIQVARGSALVIRELTLEEVYPNAIVTPSNAMHVVEYQGDSTASAPVTIFLDEVRIRGDVAMKVYNPYLIRAAGSLFEGVRVMGVQLVDYFPALPQGSATFERCDFSAPIDVHGLYTYPGDAITLRECRFSAGSFGLHIRKDYARPELWRVADHVIVDGCTFHTQKGILSNEFAPTTVSNCAFHTVDSGIVVNGPLLVTNCVFASGGGISNLAERFDHPIVVTNCDFQGQAETGVVRRTPVALDAQQLQPWLFSHCRFANTHESGATVRIETGLVTFRSCDFRDGPASAPHLMVYSGEVIAEGCTFAGRQVRLIGHHGADGFSTGIIKATLVACRFLASDAIFFETSYADTSLLLDGRDNEFQAGANIVNGGLNGPADGTLVPRAGLGADVASSSYIVLPLSENQVRVTGSSSIYNMVPGSWAWGHAAQRIFQGPWYLIGLQPGQIVATGTGPGAFAYVRSSGTVPGEARGFVLIQDPVGTFKWHEV